MCISVELLSLPPSKSWAKHQKEKYYFTGKQCYRGHINKRLTSNGCCVECNAEIFKVWNEKKDIQKRYAEILRKVKARAKQAHKPFDLKVSDLVWNEVCPVLNVPLDYFCNKKGGILNSPSLDRVDNSKGYVKGNVQIISKAANTLKSDYTKADLPILEKLIEYIKNS